MKLQEKIRDLFKLSKEKNNLNKELLKVILSEISRYKTKDVPDEEVLRIIRKMRDNAIECGNLDEVPILESYLPNMMSEGSLKYFLKEVIELNNYSGMKDMGKIMQYIKQSKFSSVIDNALASEILKELLK